LLLLHGKIGIKPKHHRVYPTTSTSFSFRQIDKQSTNKQPTDQPPPPTTTTHTPPPTTHRHQTNHPPPTITTKQPTDLPSQ
jgi:hypothetical protein